MFTLINHRKASPVFLCTFEMRQMIANIAKGKSYSIIDTGHNSHAFLLQSSHKRLPSTLRLNSLSLLKKFLAHTSDEQRKAIKRLELDLDIADSEQVYSFLEDLEDGKLEFSNLFPSVKCVFLEMVWETRAQHSEYDFPRNLYEYAAELALKKLAEVMTADEVNGEVIVVIGGPKKGTILIYVEERGWGEMGNDLSQWVLKCC